MIESGDWFPDEAAYARFQCYPNANIAKKIKRQSISSGYCEESKTDHVAGQVALIKT
jgi:hypothetical protein